MYTSTLHALYQLSLLSPAFNRFIQPLLSLSLVISATRLIVNPCSHAHMKIRLQIISSHRVVLLMKT